MKTLLENWSLFCSKLEKVKQTSNGIEALCPAHEDKKASLTASCKGEKILFKCQAGCVNNDISRTSTLPTPVVTHQLYFPFYTRCSLMIIPVILITRRPIHFQ